MKILLAPDSFKESLTAARAAQAMAAGVRRADPSIAVDSCPIGDGGGGTLDAIIKARGGETRAEIVSGPRGDAVQARYGVISDARTGVKTGIVELAQASGLHLLPQDRRDPEKATTRGTGELIRAAAVSGCREVIICVGGSATVDGGAGIVQALGGRLFDSRDKEMREPLTGDMLRSIARFEPPRREALPRLRVACDVVNPLLGPNGAAAVYGPQKGASPGQVRSLEAGLAHLVSIVGGDPNQPGSGAAGGAAFGLAAMCGAALERGIDLVLEMVEFDRRVRGADLVLTGEGRLDEQSLMGKACIGVSRAAFAHGVPTIAIVGDIGLGAERCVDPEAGLLKAFVSLTERFGRERAMKDAAKLVGMAAMSVIQDGAGSRSDAAGH